ncbi:hypothetical protein [Acidocella sp.]|uniref:hypothetical protein n=1 Tax=Acidocella sp. TaxID=50710 RepID=UPI0018478CC0|nr:hypothetical protein [Acidocella sp.]NNM56807.1 hypothetical protein [Acidocella sp.]
MRCRRGLYSPPLDDLRFLLSSAFNLDELSALFAEQGFGVDLALTLLEEAGRFCTGVLAPLNLPGDAAGCRLEGGNVLTAPGFAQAYAAFAEGGWCGLSAPPPGPVKQGMRTPE